MRTDLSDADARLNEDSALPPLCDLDLGVIETLPPDLFSEINTMYGGKLVNFISKRKGKSTQFISSSFIVPHGRTEGVTKEGKKPSNEFCGRSKEKQCRTNKAQTEPVSGPRSLDEVPSTSAPNMIDLMPSSLSQVDISVLQQLPEDLRADILEQLLPEHKRAECAPDNYSTHLQEASSMKNKENQSEPMDSVSSNLWIGNPPWWVEKFKINNCPMLNTLSNMYYKSGSTGRLSSILQRTISESQIPLDVSNDGLDDGINYFCELLKQYIKLKLETDIEEIYICIRLLRRFSMKSKFFLHVYDIIFPHLQASVAEIYGGSLHIRPFL